MKAGPGGSISDWAAAWKTVAAITGFEVALAVTLRWSLPWFVASPAWQMGISYVVFMALGEVWGQWLHWAHASQRFSFGEVLRFLRSACWASILGMVVLTALFFSWFWPWTFRLWGQHLAPAWFGAADQLFTGPLSLAPIFLLHWYLEERQCSGESAEGRRARWDSKSSAMIHTLRVSLPYWGIGIGVIFSLPLDFVFQNILTGAIQTPFTTFLFFMANRPHQHADAWRLRPWAKWALPAIAGHNLVVFPIWCGSGTLVAGLLAFIAWLWLGFERTTPASRDNTAPPDSAATLTGINQSLTSRQA